MTSRATAQIVRATSGSGSNGVTFAMLNIWGRQGEPIIFWDSYRRHQVVHFLAFGKTNRQKFIGPAKSIEYDDVGVDFTLEKQRVYRFSSLSPKGDTDAVRRRYLPVVRGSSNEKKPRMWGLIPQREDS